MSPQRTLKAFAWALGGVVLFASAFALADDDTPAKARTGRDVYELFLDGRAEARCSTVSDSRWKKRYAGAVDRLAAHDGRTLPVFAHVVEALSRARLPTEYALIPFVESGYRPQARSPAGPAGLWQFIASTARRFRIPVGKQADGRMSPVESTRAAVEYLTRLHHRFAGNWRLAAMAYNAGEHRITQALQRSGRKASEADPGHLEGVPESTRQYIEKLDAIACVMDDAARRRDWMLALDHPVRPLHPSADAGP
jgi:membrane-bound lytic murein transglycosylase D